MTHTYEAIFEIQTGHYTVEFPAFGIRGRGCPGWLDTLTFAERTHETLDLALTAFRKLKEKLNDGEIEESEVGLEIMKRFMKEEGLL